MNEAEARRRLERFGRSALARRERPPYLRIAPRQFADPLVLLLVAAAAVSAAVGEGLDAAVIAAIVVLNAALGLFQEAGAERAVMALRDALDRQASVVRDGVERALPVAELVPGDLIVLREGERVPADARLVSAEGLAVDESALTGESVRADKVARARSSRRAGRRRPRRLSARGSTPRAVGHRGPPFPAAAPAGTVLAGSGRPFGQIATFSTPSRWLPNRS